MKLVTSTGFGGSGSSAVTDILLEFDCIKEISHHEYKFLHDPNGLGDLENAIAEGHRLKVDWAVKEFLKRAKINARDWKYKKVFGDEFFPITEDFVKKLCKVSWRGNWYARLGEVKQKSFFERKRIECATGYFWAKWNRDFPLYESESMAPNYKNYVDMHYASDIENFIALSKEYTSALISVAQKRGECKEEYLFLDQLLPPIATKKYQKYFEKPVKVFIVDKDPRDLYLTNNLFWAERFNPYFNVETFIEWYRQTRIASKKSKDENTLFFMLDDLVFDTQSTYKKIYDFLEVDETYHTKKGQLFQSEKSRANVGLYKKYSNYKDDIALIERELKEFLSPYKVDESDCVVTVKRSLKDLVEECDKVQAKESKKNKVFLAVCGTYLVRKLSQDKNILKKTVHAGIGLLVFLPNMIINLVALSEK